eukprot:TRINITY_DN625_c0_g1_i1.p1 TRINITY_DN625_c0_g1~~TRINITY_DN625_c0_g1_i1.p1  ORF type:complete len:492 (+),score=58.73 TRINITY_DN625_c0_g1_i1:292-1767(+)
MLLLVHGLFIAVAMVLGSDLSCCGSPSSSVAKVFVVSGSTFISDQHAGLGSAGGWVCNQEPVPGAVVECECSCVPTDCANIKQEDPSAQSGIYNVDPDGPSGPLEAHPVFCEMTIDGGGWTLVLFAGENITNSSFDLTYDDVAVRGNTMKTVTSDHTGHPVYPSYQMVNEFSQLLVTGGSTAWEAAHGWVLFGLRESTDGPWVDGPHPSSRTAGEDPFLIYDWRVGEFNSYVSQSSEPLTLWDSAGASTLCGSLVSPGAADGPHCPGFSFTQFAGHPRVDAVSARAVYARSFWPRSAPASSAPTNTPVPTCEIPPIADERRCGNRALTVGESCTPVCEAGFFRSSGVPITCEETSRALVWGNNAPNPVQCVNSLFVGCVEACRNRGFGCSFANPSGNVVGDSINQQFSCEQACHLRRVVGRPPSACVDEVDVQGFSGSGGCSRVIEGTSYAFCGAGCLGGWTGGGMPPQGPETASGPPTRAMVIAGCNWEP